MNAKRADGRTSVLSRLVAVHKETNAIRRGRLIVIFRKFTFEALLCDAFFPFPDVSPDEKCKVPAVARTEKAN